MKIFMTDFITNKMIRIKKMRLRFFHFENSSVNRFIPTLCIMAVILLGSSCKKDFKYNTQAKDKLVVLAEITANDSAFIPVSETITAGSGEVIDFRKTNTASVSITDQNGLVRQMSLNTDPGFSTNPSAIYTSPMIFKNNTDYTLNISAPSSGPVIATTHIPKAFALQDVEAEEDEFLGKQVLDFSFILKDNADEKNYYIFEAVKEIVSVYRYFYWQGVLYNYDTPEGKKLYQDLIDDDENVKLKKDTLPAHQFMRLNVFTQDPNTANAGLNSLDSGFNRIFISDSLFGGMNYATSFFVDMSHFIAANPTEKGIVEIRVKSVDKSFYDYMLQYEKYKTSFGTLPVSQLTSPVGNIQNGLGVFGGSAMIQKKYYYDPL